MGDIKAFLDILERSWKELQKGFDDLPPTEQKTDWQAIGAVLQKTADRLRDNFPYQHPQYAGQMLKPPHPVAHLAYTLAMFINPNNHALDGGRASSEMEKQCVADIAKLFGWDQHLGHLTGGGTMANLEAIWIGRCLAPKGAVVASNQAHYTHGRMSSLLGLDFEAIRTDSRGKMNIGALEARLKQGGVGTVVATLGTTGIGALDPLPKIVSLREKYGFRLHVDAAYGGYFTLADNLSAEGREIFDVVGQADSIVIDPHKHGLQPYGCGCVLFRDPSVGRFYKHDSPYTYFSSDQLHLGEISLECSRPGASAVALWATMQLLPLKAGGRFAKDLSLCRQGALELCEKIRSDDRLLHALKPELDIVIWTPKGQNVSTISEKSKRIFHDAARENLHLALVTLPSSMFQEAMPKVEFDRETVVCLRSCLMKPEHLDWLDRIWDILDRVVGD